MAKQETSTQGGAAEAATTLTVEQLQEQLNAAQAALTAEQEAHNATKAELLTEQQDHDATKANLTFEQDAHAETKSELEAAQSIISDLEAKYADKAAEVKADKAVITVDNEQYEVLPGNYSFEGEVVNAKVLKSNPKLAAKLIDLGAGFIKKLED